MSQPVRPEDLSPEQREALMSAFASITEKVVPAIQAVLEAMKPVMEAYNKLPIELKNEIGMRQVTEQLGGAHLWGANPKADTALVEEKIKRDKKDAEQTTPAAN